MRKFLFCLLFLPILAKANQVNLDNLVTNTNNFCNQGQDGKLTGVLSYFNLNKNSDIYFKGFKVSRIEIQNPKVQTEFTPDKLLQESKKILPSEQNYAFKNLYSITYIMTLLIDSPIDQLKSKIENINGNYAYKKFGQYNPAILKQSKSILEFEKNLQNIQVPEYTASLVNNYELSMARTLLIYQCKMIAYTSDNIATISNKANN